MEYFLGDNSKSSAQMGYSKVPETWLPNAKNHR